eukprot:6185081-Pleurochrysis_carterae.AAC.2
MPFRCLIAHMVLRAYLLDSHLLIGFFDRRRSACRTRITCTGPHRVVDAPRTGSCVQGVACARRSLSRHDGPADSDQVQVAIRAEAHSAS